MKNSFWAVAFLLLLSFLESPAQVSNFVTSVAPTEALSHLPLPITVELRQPSSLQGILFLYRQFGESEYRRLEMDIIGNTARTVLPASTVNPPSLEYYMIIRTVTGAIEVYPFTDSPDPLNIPPQNTARIVVREQTDEDPAAIFLSPEPMSSVSLDELMISVSLLRADTTVDRSAVRLFLDGAEVTNFAVLSGDILTLVPANTDIVIAPGPHVASVQMQAEADLPPRTFSVSFTVRDEPGLLYTEPATTGFRSDVSLHAESRYENIGTSSEWRNRVGLTFRGRTGDLRLRSNLFVTSDEKSNRQPQNRYFLGAELPWIEVGIGDSYPDFPDLLISGKRLRGISSSLRLGAFNIDAAYGSVTRGVEGTLRAAFPVDSLLIEQTRDPRSAYGPVDALTWGKFSYGTYQRTLFALRPSFGSGETWQIGFSWLSGADDRSSIRYGIRPQENIVLATDFVTRFDESRIELTGQVAVSAFNSDISGGSFSDDYIRSVYPNDTTNIKRLRDILSPYITVNENLRPLSFEKMATLAGQASLALNYFDNALRFTYVYRGPDYTSFGQTYVRTDIQGLTVIDRIRLLRNQIFATIGFERLRDNLAATKVATTTYANANFALSYYPLSDLPGITVGYSRFSTSNGVTTDSPTSISDVTNRLYLQSSYGFELGVRHTALLNVSSSVRSDNTYRHQDVNNLGLVLGLGSRFPTLRLQTEVSAGINLNDLPGAAAGTARDFDYTVLSFHGRYDILPNEVSVFATVAPTFGDFQRTALDGGLEWRVMPPMTLSLQASIYESTTAPQEGFLSLRYRYDF